MQTGFAKTPEPPYYAVIFTSKRTADDRGYAAMAAAMMKLALEQPGCLGAESARGADGLGITVAYYRDEAAIAAWKANAQHDTAQRLGRERWYEHYELRIARIERAYSGPEGRFVKIYGDLISGNCLKVKWTAEQVGRAFTWVPVDVMKGESRTAAYLAKFPQGQVPAVEFDDGRKLAQSNAIIRYLARGTPLLPEDGFVQAQIDEWLFWEQYSHEPYIATTRFHVLYQKRPLAERDGWRVERGEAALAFMNARLAGRTWLVGDAMTIADIALVAYTRMAADGFDLAPHAHVRAWIGRCEQALKLGKDRGS